METPELREKLKAKLKEMNKQRSPHEEKKTLKWFCEYYLADIITYIYFCNQLNSFWKMKDEIKARIINFLEDN